MGYVLRMLQSGRKGAALVSEGRECAEIPEIALDVDDLIFE